DASSFGFVLPNEIFTRRMLGEDDGPDLDRDELDALIEERLGAKSEASLVPFETVAVVESHDRSRVLPLHRGLLPRVDPSKIDPSRGDFTYLPDDDNAFSPIGGTGLALIAFSKHAAVTGKTTHLERMRSMARFLVRQLDVQGVFQPYFPPNQQGLEAREVLYY